MTHLIAWGIFVLYVTGCGAVASKVTFYKDHSRLMKATSVIIAVVFWPIIMTWDFVTEWTTR